MLARCFAIASLGILTACAQGLPEVETDFVRSVSGNSFSGETLILFTPDDRGFLRDTSPLEEEVTVFRVPAEAGRYAAARALLDTRVPEVIARQAAMAGQEPACPTDTLPVGVSFDPPVAGVSRVGWNCGDDGVFDLMQALRGLLPDDL